MPDQQGNCVVIKRNRLLLLAGAVAFYLAWDGISDIIRWVRKGYCFSASGGLSTAVSAVCVILFSILGAYALAAGTQRLVLDDRGVRSGRFCFKQQISWEQIQDWGISFRQKSFWEGKIVHLYFSPEPLPLSGQSGKQFSKQTVRIFLLHSAWEEWEPAVRSYCRERLELEPFEGIAAADLSDEWL